MWAVGAVMQILGIVLYYQKGVYADCGMEFYYLAMTAYGYWKWKTLSNKEGVKEELPITHIPVPLALLWTAIFLVLWFVISKQDCHPACQQPIWHQFTISIFHPMFRALLILSNIFFLSLVLLWVRT